MHLDLTHIRQPETPVARTFAPEAFAPDDDFRVVAPAVLTATLHKDEDRYRLSGRLATTIEVVCSRCAEPYTMPVDAALELRFLPQALAGNKDEDPDDDPTTTFYADDRLDLGQVVREQCYLALPMKPLCTPDCQGLCPQCGADKNVAPCTCTRPADPRFAALAGVKLPS